MTVIPKTPIKSLPGYPLNIDANEIGRRFRELLGEFQAASVPLDLKITDQIELEGGVIRERVEYNVDMGERIVAYHLFQKGIPDDAPGILSIHGHGGEDIYPVGKAFHCHPVMGDPAQYSYHAALAGFRVLAPDALCFGERRATWGYSTNFFDEVAAHEELVLQGKSLGWKSVWDNSRALEALETLGSASLGVIGWSGGSIQSYILASVNEKVRAAACFASFLTLRHQFSQYRLCHCLYPYLPGMMKAGLDWDQVVSMIPPRKLFLGWGALDEGTPKIMFRSFVEAIESQALLESHPQCAFVHEEPHAGHEITMSMLQSALEFLRIHVPLPAES